MIAADQCPGCTNSKPSNEICCNACWKSIPTSIPGLPRVRTTLRDLRRFKRWPQLEDAMDTLRAWLAENYIDRLLPVIAAGDNGDKPGRTGVSR